MEIYDPCCSSGGLLNKSEIAMEEKTGARTALSAGSNASKTRADKAVRAPFGREDHADCLANSVARLFPKGTLLMAMYGTGSPV
ncbi:MAG TPA: hypothetical protein VEH04_06070 [Verrucomicrobiae bacterium]|nr:hypothetical protein [Verrucomicrobiae bacterium]